METEEEVDILMSSDVYSATLSTKSITFSRSQIGWLFREDKTVRPHLFILEYFGLKPSQSIVVIRQQYNKTLWLWLCHYLEKNIQLDKKHKDKHQIN